MIIISENSDGSLATERINNLLSLQIDDINQDNLEDIVYRKNIFDRSNQFKIADDYYSCAIERPKMISKNEIINTNRELIKIYLRTKISEGKSLETIGQYKWLLEHFFIYIVKPIETITAEDIRNFLFEYHNIHDINYNTLDGLRIILNCFFNFLEEEDFILKSPMKKIKRIKGEKVVKTPFTEEEIERLRDCCKDIRELAMVDFLDSTAVRLSELCSLNKIDLDLDDKEGIVHGKGNKQRIIYLSSRCKLHLEEYLKSRFDESPALFVKALYPYDRISKRGVEYVLREIGRRANVTCVHPHRFRRTVATRLLYKGVPLEQVQRILGHTKIETTLIYTEVNQGDVKANHSKYI